MEEIGSGQECKNGGAAIHYALVLSLVRHRLRGNLTLKRVGCAERQRVTTNPFTDMTKERQQRDERGKPYDSKGEFILLSILGVFVIIAIAGMTVIDYYGTQRMGDSSRIHDAANR